MGRSPLYRVWSIGGLLAVIGFVADTAVTRQAGERAPIPQFVVAIGICFAGLEGFGFLGANRNLARGRRHPARFP